MEAAAEYILTGPPVRYGSLTLADFFPTAQMLSDAGVKLDGILKKEYDRGVHNGFRLGRVHESEQVKLLEAGSE